MSISATIDISILKNDRYHFSVQDLLHEMLRNDWNIKKNGKICYLPFNDKDFDWIEEDISETDFLEIASKKEEKNEIIGVIFYWKNTDIGMSMLLFQDYQITFQITINRRKLNTMLDITDVNWYFKNIIVCFDKFKIIEINFSQTW